MLNGVRLFDLKGHKSEIKQIAFNLHMNLLVSFDCANKLRIFSYGVFAEPRLTQSLDLGPSIFNSMMIGTFNTLASTFLSSTNEPLSIIY